MEPGLAGVKLLKLSPRSSGEAGAKLRKITIFRALIFLSLSIDTVLGCVCLPAKTIKAERLKDFRQASVVFTGEVVSLDRFRVKFKVNKIWKGQETGEITMLTGATDLGNGILPLLNL